MRGLFFVGVIGLLVGAMALVGLKLVTVKMLPFDNKSEFQVIIDMPNGTTLEETARVTQLLAVEAQKQPEVVHHVIGRDGRQYDGGWVEIVDQMREASAQGDRTSLEFMQSEARRGFGLTGVLISTADAESFVRGSADAGMLRIVR